MNIKRIKFILMLTTCCLLLPAAYSFGWSKPVAIDAGPSSAYRTDIAFDRNGNAIAIFEQKINPPTPPFDKGGTEGGFYRVFASRYVKDKGWKSAVPIDSGIGNAYRGQVAFDKEGNAIVVFKQENRVFANYYKTVSVNSDSVSKNNSITNTDTDTNPPQSPFTKSPLVPPLLKGGVGGFRGILGGWQGAVPIDNGTGPADGQDIVFDSEGNAAAVFEAQDGEEMGIYVNIYINGKGWQGPVRIDKSSIFNLQSSISNAYFPYPLFDDKGNLYVLYYKEESGGLEVYVSRIKKQESRGKMQDDTNTNTDTYITHVRITDGYKMQEARGKKQEKWAEKKSEITRGIKAVYNPNFLGEIKKRIYSGNFSYSRWETPSKLDARFRDAYRPTLLANGNGEITALFVKWDGEYLSAYASDYRNGKWGKPEEIDSGKGDVEHIRGAVNSEGEMAVVWTQWVDGNLRIHARIKNSVSDSVGVSKIVSVNSVSVRKENTDTHTYTDTSSWGEAEIIDAGKKDAYNPSIIFTDSGEIIAVWCQWEKVNVKSYTNIYRKGIGWGNAERLENEDGETCGVRIASGTDGKVIAIFEQERNEGREAGGKPTNRIFAVELRFHAESGNESKSVTLNSFQGLKEMPKQVRHDNSYSVRRLTHASKENYYAEFSPDGKMIVFVSKHAPERFNQGQGKSSNLYIMDVDGKNMRQLTSGNATDTAPVWTSDGGRIIFASNRTDERWDIWSINTDGTGLTRLTKDKTNELAPRTTLDGRNIVFVSTAGGDHAIWSMDINGENKKRLTSGGTGDWFPAMNPDGKEVVFVSTRLGNGDVWTIDSMDKKYHRLTYTDLPEFSPAWSPDGSKIAYVTNKGGEFDIWIMDRDGKNKRRLTKGISDGNWGSRFSSRKILETAGFYHLSWHPDGSKILFTEWKTDTNTDTGTYISILEFDKEIIDRLEVDSTPIHDWTLIGEKELTAGEWEDFAPSFSPDGTSLVFSSNRSGNWDVWRLRIEDCRLKIEDCKSMVDNENPEQLTKGDNDELAPAYSPDGKEIAFLRGKNSENLQSSIFNPQYDMWLMNSDGSNARQITKNIPIKSYPAWNPNGKEIAYITQGKDGHEIWIYNLESSKVQKLITTHDSQLTAHSSQNYPFKEFLYRIGYNPSGDKITFESNRSGNIEIWTMRSDGTNLARLTNGDSPHWNPDWSPDGKMIAYTSDKLGDEAGLHNWRNYNIWIANPETQKEMLITGEEQIDWNPVWSPDGKKIVYVTNRSGEFKHNSLWVLYLK